MKLGIRTQMNLAFVLVVVIPLAVTFILFTIVSVRINNAPDYEHLSQPDTFFEKMIQEIQVNFIDIKNYEIIMKELDPYFDKFEGHLQVIDTENRILFDSSDSEAFIKNNAIFFEDIYGNEDTYGQKNLNHKRRINPVFYNNELVGVSIFEYEENKAIGSGVRSIMFYIIMSIVGGFVCLIVLMFLLSLLITRNILTPLKELGIATRKIAQGDLDFNIYYSKKNELGRFCEAFTSMKEQLQAAIIKQKQEENEKKELIASISHDLRTPMTSIKGYVEALKDGKAKDSETYTKYLSIIEKKTEGLDRLIDDLSMFSKLELGKMTMYYEEVDSREMLENIASIKESEYDGDEISVLIKRPFPSVKLKADVERINQVVDNLFDNARKYSSVKCVITMESNIKENFLQICIRDNGAGIADQDLPYIFDRFYRGEKSRSREYGGTGLGLAICKFIIKEHGGTIQAQSKPGQGTKICFQLPI